MTLGDIPSFVDIEHVDSDYWLVSSPREKSRSERMMQKRLKFERLADRRSSCPRATTVFHRAANLTQIDFKFTVIQSHGTASDFILKASAVSGYLLQSVLYLSRASSLGRKGLP